MRQQHIIFRVISILILITFSFQQAAYAAPPRHALATGNLGEGQGADDVDLGPFIDFTKDDEKIIQGVSNPGDENFELKDEKGPIEVFVTDENGNRVRDADGKSIKKKAVIKSGDTLNLALLCSSRRRPQWTRMRAYLANLMEVELTPKTGEAKGSKTAKAEFERAFAQFVRLHELGHRFLFELRKYIDGKSSAFGEKEVYVERGPLYNSVSLALGAIGDEQFASWFAGAGLGLSPPELTEREQNNINYMRTIIAYIKETRYNSLLSSLLHRLLIKQSLRYNKTEDYDDLMDELEKTGFEFTLPHMMDFTFKGQDEPTQRRLKLALAKAIHEDKLKAMADADTGLPAGEGSGAQRYSLMSLNINELLGKGDTPGLSSALKEATGCSIDALRIYPLWMSPSVTAKEIADCLAGSPRPDVAAVAAVLDEYPKVRKIETAAEPRAGDAADTWDTPNLDEKGGGVPAEGPDPNSRYKLGDLTSMERLSLLGALEQRLNITFYEDAAIPWAHVKGAPTLQQIAKFVRKSSYGQNSLPEETTLLVILRQTLEEEGVLLAEPAAEPQTGGNAAQQGQYGVYRVRPWTPGRPGLLESGGVSGVDDSGLPVDELSAEIAKRQNAIKAMLPEAGVEDNTVEWANQLPLSQVLAEFTYDTTKLSRLNDARFQNVENILQTLHIIEREPHQNINSGAHLNRLRISHAATGAKTAQPANRIIFPKTCLEGIGEERIERLSAKEESTDVRIREEDAAIKLFLAGEGETNILVLTEQLYYRYWRAIDEKTKTEPDRFKVLVLQNTHFSHIIPTLQLCRALASGSDRDITEAFFLLTHGRVLSPNEAQLLREKGLIRMLLRLPEIEDTQIENIDDVRERYYRAFENQA